MNLTTEEKRLLKGLRIDPESGYHRDAYSSLKDGEKPTAERLERAGLVETNGFGYRLTVAGVQAIKTGRYLKPPTFNGDETQPVQPVKWVENHGVHKAYFHLTAFRATVGFDMIRGKGYLSSFSMPGAISIAEPYTDLRSAKRAALELAVSVLKRALKEAEDLLKRFDALEGRETAISESGDDTTI